MALYIREYVGGLVAKNITSYKRKSAKNLSESYSSGCSTRVKKGSLMQNIEGIHVGPTRNFTWYTESALLSSISSWTSPYLRPLIMHHNETDGKIIGRIHDAEYVTVDTRSKTPAIKFLCNIPDKEGIEQVQDGRLNTTSIGVIAHDVRCNICGEQVEVDEDGLSECGHIRGEEYKGTTCYWMIHSMEAKELSYVIVPSDIYAHNLDNWFVGDNEHEKLQIAEGAENYEGGEKKVKKNEIKEALKNGKIITTTEGVAISANGDVKDANESRQQDKGEGEKEDGEEGHKKEGQQESGEEKVSNEKEEQGQADKIKVLEDANKELSEKLEALEADKAAKDVQLVELKKVITVAQETISEIVKENEEKDALVEAAENEALAAKGELRDFLEADLASFQTLAEEEVSDKTAMAIETKESLVSKITSLKEKVSAKKKTVTITEAADTTLKRNNQFKEKVTEDVNKTNKSSNVSLEEALNDLFS